MAPLPWRYILHADLDAFYASVEQHDRPELRGRPLVVGGAPESRGVVMAASYEARKYGVRSALPMAQALRLCPHLVRVPPRFDRYHDVSGQVMGLFRSLTALVEPLSLDEAYLDVTVQCTVDTVEELARRLKSAVRDRTGLTVTIGGGTSKTVAKIASKQAKPDGLLLVRPGEERAFLDPLDIDLLWGVGPKTAELLRQQGIQTVRELAEREEEWALSTLGKRGAELRLRALGADVEPVTPYRETKSVSAETTLPRDQADASLLLEVMRGLAQRVADRLQDQGLKGRTVSVKLRLADFTTFTRQTALPFPTDDLDLIRGKACDLLRRELTGGRRFRLLGVGVSNFEEPLQLRLPDA